jgi:uncharacterized protein (TIGR00251 family)
MPQQPAKPAAAPAADPADAIADTPGGCIMQIKVIPRSPQTMIDGMRGGALLVKLSAPPVEGQANESLLRFIAHICDVPRRAVTLMSGERSRNKAIRVNHVTRAEATLRVRACTRRSAAVLPRGG